MSLGSRRPGTSGVLTSDVRQAPWPFRFGLVVAAAAFFACAMSLVQNADTVEDQLARITAQRELPPQLFAEVKGAPKVAALLVDPRVDPELRFKMSLAIIKYGARGRQVLDAYADDEQLQSLLRIYGEQFVPVVAFFMDNSILTLRARYGLERLTNAAKAYFRRSMSTWRGEEVEVDVAPALNTPVNRGLNALEEIEKDGYHFLGQFDIDGEGKAHWNNTSRGLAFVESLLVGGLRDLESKRNRGEATRFGDWAWAGADVAVLFSAAKGLKLMNRASVIGTETKLASEAGGSAVQGSVRGAATGAVEQVRKAGVRYEASAATGAVKFGAKVGAAYLVFRHPGLLTSLFRWVGGLIGLPPWLCVGLGWWLVGMAIALFLLPLVFGLKWLIPILRSVSNAARWIMRGSATPVTTNSLGTRC